MKKPVKFQNIHQDLIDECLNGSRRAQFKIYQLYWKAMFNTCIRIIGKFTEAEDIMQEAFLKAFLKLPEYRQEVSFGAWLKRIVVNESINALRSRKIIFESLENLLNEDIVEEYDENEIATTISPVVIFKEIEKLPEGYRIVLSLYLIEGYDHNEIAEILKISASSSRSQYARAKQKLLLNLKKNIK